MENIQKKFNQEEIFKNLKNIGDHTTKVIINFAEIKQYKFDNRKQIKSFLKRNRSQAKELNDYPLEKIINTLNWLQKNTDFKYTISTVHKYIDENLDKMGQGGKPLTEEDLINKISEKYAR